MQAHREDNAVLRKQLTDSHNLCSALEGKLDALGVQLDELLHQDPYGNVDVIDITNERVSGFKNKLSEAARMAGVLSLSLSGK